MICVDSYISWTPSEWEPVRYIQLKVENAVADWFDQNCTITSKAGFLSACMVALMKLTEEGKLPRLDVMPKEVAMRAVEMILADEVPEVVNE